MFPIPWLAILVATVASFFLGALWYSPVLFGPAWRREIGLSGDSCQGQPKFGILATTFILTLISTSVLSFCLSPRPGMYYGAIAGLVIGLGWVTTSIGTNLLFEGKSFKLFAINCGFHVTRFVVAGVILGVMQ